MKLLSCHFQLYWVTNRWLQELLLDPVWWLSSCTVVSLTCGTLIGRVFGDVWWERTDALKDCHIMREKLGIIYWSVNKDLKDDVLVFHLITQSLNERLLNWSAEKIAAGQCRDTVTLGQLWQLYLCLCLFFYPTGYRLSQTCIFWCSYGLLAWLICGWLSFSCCICMSAHTCSLKWIWFLHSLSFAFVWHVVI